MGRLINTSDLHNQVLLNKNDWGIFATTIDNLIEDIVSQVKTAEAIPEAEYETRLKADMMDIFEDLKKEIENQSKIPNNSASAYDWNNGVYACYKVIQQKRKSILKGE
jgi:hypothetical protein